MNAAKSAVLSLDMAVVRGLRMGATGLDTLRTLGGAACRPLGHDLAADYAFLASDCSRSYAGTLRELVRSFVWLPGAGALVDCDIAVAAAAPVSVGWKLDGGRADSVARIRPKAANPAPAAESLLLNVIWTAEPRPLAPIDSIDMAGLRIGDHVVAFHTETRMERSAVSFDVDGEGEMQFLLTGLAPGEWEVWFAGMLEIPDAEVQPESGTLHFAGRRGGYFLRRLGS